MKTHKRIPADFPVRPLKPGQDAKSKATCGHCGLSWDDAIVTGWTPAPAARCPFEYFHVHPELEAQEKRRANARRKAQRRLEYIRGEIIAERISNGEIAELESLAAYIDPADTLLLEWAGVEEWTS